jgi:hypothetical protein
MKRVILNSFRDKPVPASINYTSREQYLLQRARDLSQYEFLQRPKISKENRTSSVYPAMHLTERSVQSLYQDMHIEVLLRATNSLAVYREQSVLLPCR